MFIIRLAIYTCHPSNGRFVGCSRLHESLSYLSSSGLITVAAYQHLKGFWLYRYVVYFMSTYRRMKHQPNERSFLFISGIYLFRIILY